MGEITSISWTDHTFNPWIGCQKVSPGCDNCYAEALMDKRWGKVQWGPHGERKRTSAANWKLPLRWDRAAAAAGKRAKVFCASLADWLDNQVPREWRYNLWELIDATPNLNWLLLTKRIENYHALAPWHLNRYPKNVWLGITAEDQKHYDRRMKILVTIPAALRFVSYEPALGPIEEVYVGGHAPDWIIMGGESGANARPMDLDWARDLRDRCEEAEIAFHFKQWGGSRPDAGGCILDGIEHKAFPVYQ